MAACVSVDPNTAVLSLDTVTSIESCQYVLVQSSEFTTISGLNELFAQYFSFDAELFAIIVVGSLTTYATGHTLGRMMQAWRKVM